jgi:hypothetical protein
VKTREHGGQTVTKRQRIERKGELSFVEDDPYCAWSFAIDGEDITKAIADMIGVRLGPYDRPPLPRVPKDGETFGRWRVTIERMEWER